MNALVSSPSSVTEVWHTPCQALQCNCHIGIQMLCTYLPDVTQTERDSMSTSTYQLARLILEMSKTIESGLIRQLGFPKYPRSLKLKDKESALLFCMSLSESPRLEEMIFILGNDHKKW